MQQMMQAMTQDRTFDWRAIERSDAAAWAQVLTAIHEVDKTWEYFSEEDLLEDFDDPYRDFERGSVAIFRDGLMIGYGSLAARDAADPVHEMRYHGGVHPGYRGRGLGSQLLAWAEAAAVPLHQRRYPGCPLSLSGKCPADNADAMALYAEHGYRPVRWFHGMTRELAAPLSNSPVPAGVKIAGLTPGRYEHARLVRNEAFHDHWGSTEISADGWAYFMEIGAFRAAFSFLAYAGSEPVGFIVSHEYDTDAETPGVRDLYVSALGTRSTHRKRGIASALLVRALAEAKAAGFTSASLEVDADSLTGALGLYQRAGFSVAHTSVTQTKTLLGAEPTAH
jgi:mycothiol synthase